MGESGEHKSDGLSKPAKGKTDQVGAAVESDWDLFDLAGEEYDRGFGSLAPKDEEDPPSAKSSAGYMVNKEPLSSSDFFSDLDEDTNGKDIYSDVTFKTGEYKKWDLSRKSESPRTEKDSGLFGEDETQERYSDRHALRSPAVGYPEREENPSPARSSLGERLDEEPYAPLGLGSPSDEDPNRRLDPYWNGAYQDLEEESGDYLYHSRTHRRWKKGKILLWGCTAALLLLAFAFLLRLVSYERSKAPEWSEGSNNVRQSTEREDPWTHFESVSYREEKLIFDLWIRFGTLALIYPKQLEVQPIEAALKNEQARRKADGALPFSKPEQTELIDRMLLEQILVVTSEQVDAQLKEVEEEMRKSSRQRFSVVERQKQRTILLEKMIDTAVLGLEGLKTLPDISGEARAYCDRVRMGFSDESSFTRWAKYTYGSEEGFRRWAKVKIAAEKYRTEVESREGKVAEDKIRSYYQENLIFYEEPERATIAQIFIRVPAGATESERETRESKVRRIQDQLRSGASFGALAAKYSEGGNTGRGGMLGTIERDELAPELRAVVFNLRPNEISPVIRTGKGFHILKLISRNSQRTRSYDEARGEIFSRLSQEQVRKFMPTHIAELRRDLVIKKR
jgi:hypothetical protein